MTDELETFCAAVRGCHRAGTAGVACLMELCNLDFKSALCRATFCGSTGASSCASAKVRSGQEIRLRGEGHGTGQSAGLSRGRKRSVRHQSAEAEDNSGYDLPKVQLREDEDGNIHLRNLSVNMAQKEEDALNLLFLGSHCMFIMWVESTKPDSDTVRRAKLHLVDLAGSERISKTGVEGHLQKEARYINLSLHYLEQVIVALHERTTGARNHVPYRNSMMTSVLRDSLGGNCKTVMVGTAAIEDRHLEESMSTCRFAQRVAAIKNNATVNEELDPALLIRRLKKEAAELKDELKLLNGEAEELNAEDKEECKKLVQGYLVQQDL
eukprot:g15836.t1